MHDIGRVSIDQLMLDPHNPRLPWGVEGSSQDELLKHLFENDVLDELAASFVVNGYFENEPILVLAPDRDGKRIVVEGNRRVSTLMILTGAELARQTGIEFALKTVPSEPTIQELRSVPAYEVENREELSSYLGYRHIGGIRPWPAESKARWIHRSVVRAADEGIEDPFYDVGRTFGSNARGVRTTYLMREVLERARIEGDVDTSYVEQQRFSVWGNLLANSQIREYVGLDATAKSYSDVQDALESIDPLRVGEVVADLTPSAQVPALLGDSRQVLKYAEVLSNKRANETLRKYGDLSVAFTVLEQGAFADRLKIQGQVLRELLVEASSATIDQAVVDAAIKVAERAKSIRAVVSARLPDDE